MTSCRWAQHGASSLGKVALGRFTTNMATKNAAPYQSILTDMAHRVGKRLAQVGDVETQIAGLSLFRREAPAPPVTCLIEPSIVLVAQGRKQMWVGGRGYPYDARHFLLTSLDVPANSEVVEAHPDRPCVGLCLKIDLRTVADLVAQGAVPAGPPLSVNGMSVGIGTVTEEVLSPVARLLALLDEPAAIPVLAPLIQREIHFRLLLSDQAPLLRQIVAVDGQGKRIAKAIDWLKIHFAEPVRVDDLAARARMSAPTFHHHFRQLTAMSPLQYQKWLRLNEAKRLMLNEQMDAATAAFRVGYESPSQFSREYSRMFGMPPKRDIESLRSQALGAVA
jgi:AraC-like DNA-binding protein